MTFRGCDTTRLSLWVKTGVFLTRSLPETVDHSCEMSECVGAELHTHIKHTFLSLQRTLHSLLLVSTKNFGTFLFIHTALQRHTGSYTDTYTQGMNNDFLSELSADFCQFSRELPLPTRYVCESARTQRPLCFSQKNEGCFLFLLRFICKIDVTDEYKMKQNVYSAMIKYFPP